MLPHQFRDIRYGQLREKRIKRSADTSVSGTNRISTERSQCAEVPVSRLRKIRIKAGYEPEVARVLNFQARATHSVGLLPAVPRGMHSWHHRQSHNRLRDGSCTGERNDDSSIFTRAGRWLADRPRSPAFRASSHVTLTQFACII